MKIYMNGYPNHWLSPYTLVDHAFFWTAWSRCHRATGIIDDNTYVVRPDWADRLADRLTPVCEIIKQVWQIVNPKIRLVKIDPYDTWSMDHTLSHIIHPMLIQLKQKKHGAPVTDDEDVPENLRSCVASPRDNSWDTDEFFFARWDWILDEMIWAFEQQLRDDDESQFFDHSESSKVTDWNEKMNKIKIDQAGLQAHQARKANGFRLFGKYYSALWD